MSKLAIMSEFWDFLKVTEEMVVNTDCNFSCIAWCTDYFYRGFSGSAIYIYAILDL